MKLSLLTFTDRGYDLACRLQATLGGTVERSRDTKGLDHWTRQHFCQGEGLVYVGAAAIAVRAIAPYVSSKATDPAVLAIDEGGSFVIPLLSGHLGGANDLARRVADVIGAMPVITTATDGRGLFAVDSWARHQHLRVMEVSRIKKVSAKLLEGRPISLHSRWPLPEPAPVLVKVTEVGPWDVSVDVMDVDDLALHLVPGIVVLGVGCRRGTTVQVLEMVFNQFRREQGLFVESVAEAATIDLKHDESGLREFCDRHGWPLSFESAEELASVEGSQSASEFVRSITGVDNVCERAALYRSEGKLLFGKYAAEGVTFAAALKPFSLDWSF